MISFSNPFPTASNSILSENTPRLLELYPNLKKVPGKLFSDEYLYITLDCISLISSDVFIKIRL